MMTKKKVISDIYFFTGHTFHLFKGHVTCFHLLLPGTYSNEYFEADMTNQRLLKTLKLIVHTSMVIWLAFSMFP